MKLVIIESPYSGNVGRNKLYLQACIKDCLRRGESPYASHQMLTEALNDLKPEERDAGIKAGFAFHQVADYSAVYYDFGVSEGMQLGAYNMQHLGRPVLYRKLGGVWEYWHRLETM